MQRTIFFLGVGAFMAGLGILFFWQVTNPDATGTSSETKTFEVLPGEKILTIGEHLAEEGLIASRYAFAYRLWKEDRTRGIVAGTYRLSGRMTLGEIIETLSEGKVVAREKRLTFPEGWTSEKMAERLSANDLPGDAFLALVRKPKATWRTEFPFLENMPAAASLEGFLFPDTYLFDPESSAETIVERMLANFKTKYDDELRSAAAKQQHSLFEIVTLSSIVEREVASDRDRRLVADIFWRRLAIGQPLQSDATVNYALGTSKSQPSLTDLDTNSPYNTYRYPGLPPGPIGNPGYASLRATLFPESNPYFYFLSNLETGETVFAVTFEEHIRNRREHGL